MKSWWKRLLGLQAAALLFLAASAQAQQIPDVWFVNALGGDYPVHFSVTDNGGTSHLERAWFGWVWSEGGKEEDWPSLYPGPKPFRVLENLSSADHKVRRKVAKASDLGFPALGKGPGRELWLLVEDGDAAHVAQWERLLDTIESAYRQVVSPGVGGDAPHGFRRIGELGPCQVWSFPFPEKGSSGGWQPHALNQVAPEAVDASSYEGGSGAAKTVRVHRFLRWLDNCGRFESGPKALRLFPLFDQPEQHFLEVSEVSTRPLGWRDVAPDGWTSGARKVASLRAPDADTVELSVSELSGDLCVGELEKYCEDEAELRKRLYIFGKEGGVPEAPRRELLETCKTLLSQDKCPEQSFTEPVGPYQRVFSGTWRISSTPPIQSEMTKAYDRVLWTVESEAVRKETIQITRIEAGALSLLVVPASRSKGILILGLVIGGLLVLVWQVRKHSKDESLPATPPVEGSGDAGATPAVQTEQADVHESSMARWGRRLTMWRQPPQSPQLGENAGATQDEASAKALELITGPAFIENQIPTDTSLAQSPQPQAPAAEPPSPEVHLEDEAAEQEGIRPEEEIATALEEPQSALEEIQQAQRDLREALLQQASELLDTKLEGQRTQLFTELSNLINKELEGQLVTLKEGFRRDLNLDTALQGALDRIRDAERLGSQTVQEASDTINSDLDSRKAGIVEEIAAAERTALSGVEAAVEQQKEGLLSSLRGTLQRELPDHAEKAIQEARDKALEEIRKDNQQEISKVVEARWKPYADFFERTVPVFEDKARLDQALGVLRLLDGNPGLAAALVKLAERLPFEGYLPAVAPDHLGILEESREWADKHGRAGYTRIGEEVARLEPGEAREAFVRALESLGQLGFWIRCLWSALLPLGSFREIVDPLPEPARQEWLGALRCLRSFELVDAPVFRRAARWNGDGFLVEADWKLLDLEDRMRTYLVRPGDQGIVTQAEWAFLESSGLASEKSSLANRLQNYLIHRGKPGRLGEVCLALQYLVEAFPKEHVAGSRRSELERHLRDTLTSASLPPDFHSLLRSAAEGVGFIYRPVPYYRSRLDDSHFAFIERSVGAIDLAERIGFAVDLADPYVIVRLDSPFFFAARDEVYYTGRACIARQ